MGCDIHLYLEVQDESGRWHMVPDPRHFFVRDEEGEENVLNTELLAEYRHGVRKLPVKLPWNPEEFLGEDGKFDHKKWWGWRHPFEIGNDRHYSVFAMLADVRNGHGFAGCDTGDGFKPISMPKGVPSNASPEYLAVVERWSGDGHSHSYFTLEELLAYDWSGQKTKHRGVVGMLEYTKWIKSGAREKGKGPAFWSGGVSGRDVVSVPNDKMEQVVRECGLYDALKEDVDLGPFGDLAYSHQPDKVQLPRPKDGKSYHTQVQWEETYAESAGSFLTVFVAWLGSLGLPPDKVRIIFFFDN